MIFCLWRISPPASLGGVSIYRGSMWVLKWGKIRVGVVGWGALWSFCNKRRFLWVFGGRVIIFGDTWFMSDEVWVGYELSCVRIILDARKESKLDHSGYSQSWYFWILKFWLDLNFESNNWWLLARRWDFCGWKWVGIDFEPRLPFGEIEFLGFFLWN
jgi:hypothetical protein